MRFTKLRGAIIQSGYQHTELAKAIGLCPASLSARITAKKPFTLDEMYQIMDKLKLPYSELHTYFPKNGKESIK